MKRTPAKSPAAAAGNPSPLVSTSPGASGVEDFMLQLNHPLKAEIETVRKIICAVDPAISEEIKWNAPGFRAHESFATVHLRSTDKIQIIFHLGAKVRKPLPDMKIDDPASLMKWLAEDRCLVTAGAGATLMANKEALRAIVRAWLAYV